MGLSKHKPAKNYRLKTISALVASVCSFPVLGLELGRLQIQSGIGEPLLAEIEVIDISNEEMRSLKAQIASPGSFRQAGLEFNPSLRGATASLVNRGNGRRHITIKGENPVMDTFVDVILELQWSSGKLVKNYALLLNALGSNQTDRSQSASGAGQELRLAAVPPTPLTLVTDTVAGTPNVPQAISMEKNGNNVPVYRFPPVETTPSLTSPSSVQPSPVATLPQPSTAKTELLQSSLTPGKIEINQDNVPVYRFPSNEGQVPPIRTNDTSVDPSKPALEERRSKSSKRVSGSNRRQAPEAKPALSITVKRGDTAAQLALRHLSQDITLDQMLLAMLKANPNSFIDGNVNLIKAGSTLNIPSAEEAAQTPAAEARGTVLTQAREFAEYARRLASSAVVVRGKNTREMSGKVLAEAPKAEVNATQPDKLTLSTPPNPRGSTEELLAKEQERQDASAQLAALSKNLQDLESLAKKEAPKSEASPAAPTSDNPAGPSSSAESPSVPAIGQQMDSSASISDRLLENKQIWGWAAGLLAAMVLFIFWMRRTSKPIEDVHSPSYNDIMDEFIDPASPLRSEPSSGIPAQMASIDLNLQAQEPVTDNIFAQSRPSEQTPMSGLSESTQVNKLNLASELMNAGDIDLARSLITSVASTAQGDIKVRALQMLGQIK